VPDLHDVERFLTARYGPIDDLAPLAGGVWSSAFGFRVGERALVVRFGEHVGDYEKDRMAAAWSPPLPIPAVLDVGDADGAAFAVSERIAGEPLDALTPERMPVAIDSLLGALEALGHVTLPGRGHGMWWAPTGDAAHATWSDFLTSVPERDDSRIAGWRPRLAASPVAQDVFDRAQRDVVELAAQVSDARDVVHGDLLAGNVLVTPDDRICALLDWGNSLAGDALYDLAWLMFWAPWHPGIDPAHVRDVAAARFGAAGLDERLRCYQLHIALDGMQFQAFAGRIDDLHATAAQTSTLLRSR
jgi:hygromycin-B 4-O-kinase